MRQPSSLPPELRDTAFTTADARARGVRPWRLQSSDVAHPFHGVNVVGDARGDPASIDVVDLCDRYLLRMLPDQWFSHATAALLLGIPLPPRICATPLHVSVRSPRTPPRARGTVGHKMPTHVAVRAWRSRLPVCSPPDVWCQLSVTLSRADLVAAGDYLVGARGRDAIADLSELGEASARYGRGRGSINRDWALERIRFGADSRPESLLRLQLADFGLPEPRVNPPVAVRDGTRVLHPDLLLPHERVVFEYEGDGHRIDRRQWLDDIDRRDWFEDAGYRVVRVTSRRLFSDPSALRQRLRALDLVPGGAKSGFSSD